MHFIKSQHNKTITNVIPEKSCYIIITKRFFQNNSSVIYFLILLFYLWLGYNPVIAQEQSTPLEADTTTFISVDSVLIDSAAIQEKKADIEDPVNYWGDDINLSDGGNIITLIRNAKLTYQNMVLTAGFIQIDRKKNTLYARGLPDSLDADSNIVFTATPVFEEKGDEPIRGDQIEYNFKTKRGKIFEGKTEMDPGYYKGEQINKISDNTMLVRTGYFTSCEYIDDPHYYFKSTCMRVKVKDQVIAEPVYFYIAGVPLMALPFGIFPNKRGRHSGIVIPTYGESSVGGRFLRGMGYYWAPNDYFDAEFLTDYYENLGFTYRTRLQYNVRYKLNGSIAAQYLPYNLTTGKRQDRWNISYSHSQQIDPTLRISGSGRFVSDKTFVQELSPDMDDRLNQNLQSNFTLSKSWKGTKNSLTIGLNSNQNLQTDQLDYTLPNLSFNHSRSNLYEMFSGNSLGAKRSWYQNIYFAYNSRMLHRGSRIRNQDSTFTTTEKSGIQHRLSFSAPQKIFKYFSISPSFNYREDWVNEVSEANYNPDTKGIELEDKKQFAARRTFDMGINVKTTLFGYFETNIGSLKAIRHKVDPSVSFSFHPDFSDPGYGYYTSAQDSNGTIHYFDRFSKSAFGGTPSSRNQSMNLRLGNVFQAKTIDGEGKEKKIDLLTVNFSTNYNFLADSLNFSQLSTNLATTILDQRFDVRMTHSFYKPKADGSGNINQFNGLPRLLSLSTSFGFSINNKTFEKEEKPAAGRRAKKADIADEETEEEAADEDEGLLENPVIEQEYRDFEEETKRMKLPWTASFNLNYSLNRYNVNEPDHRVDLSTRASFHLTKNWKVSWNARVDLEEMEITSQSFNIYRDLHCWEMSFGWQPSINYYNFRINIKSSVLKDLKLEKTPSRSARYY